MISCKEEKKKNKIIEEVPAKFQMYKTSEMAELMRLMLAENEILKDKIIKEEEISDFNEAYLKIHTAELTDSSAFDASFTTYATYFLEMQKQIFEVAKEDRKNQFNETINACIACHQNRCTGPIPRIEKLKIH